MGILLKNAYVADEDTIGIKDVLIEDGYIKLVGNLNECFNKENMQVIDLSGYYIVPGFIDCHTHGFNGFDVESKSEDLLEMAKRYAMRGITGFYATIGPRTNEEYKKIIDNYRVFDKKYEGSEFLGLHLEGPFLNPEKKGAMDENRLRDVDLNDVEELIEYAGGIIKIMTIAPEKKDALDAVKILTKNGITMSMGHTMATYDEALEGIEVGITHATHTYDAMRQYSHRETGVLGAAMLSKNVYCELIMDLCHVSLEAVKILIAIKGAEKIIAVSDGDRMCGTKCKDQDMGSYIIKNGAMYLKNGTLCGSTKDVADHFKTLIQKIGVSIPDAVKMTSTNCAVHMGLNKGRIKEGYDADINILTNEFELAGTFVRGNKMDNFTL